MLRLGRLHYKPRNEWTTSRQPQKPNMRTPSRTRVFRTATVPAVTSSSGIDITCQRWAVIGMLPVWCAPFVKYHSIRTGRATPRMGWYTADRIITGITLTPQFTQWVHNSVNKSCNWGVIINIFYVTHNSKTMYLSPCKKELVRYNAKRGSQRKHTSTPLFTSRDQFLGKINQSDFARCFCFGGRRKHCPYFKLGTWRKFWMCMYPPSHYSPPII